LFAAPRRLRGSPGAAPSATSRLQRRPVPNADGPVQAARGEPLALRVERHTAHPVAVTAEGQGFLAAFGVPDLHRPVAARRGQAVAPGAERQVVDDAGVAAERAEFLAAGRIPEVDF